MVRRVPLPTTPSKPMRPSPVSPEDTAIVTSPPPVSDRAVSLSTRAGTSALADRSLASGYHCRSRRLARKRSVAISEIVEPSSSRRTPVSSGSISSRPAAALAWATAVEKSSDLTVPVAVGISGSCGYSSTGMVCRLNRALPQTTWTLVPSSDDVDRLVRQGLDDLGEQPAGHERACRRR